MKKRLVKIFTAVLSAVLILALVSCGGAKTTTTYNPELPAAVVDDYKQYLGETFNSKEDLSDCQGYKN